MSDLYGLENPPKIFTSRIFKKFNLYNIIIPIVVYSPVISSLNKTFKNY